MVDLDTCRFVVWGFKNTYATLSHVLEGFFRALQFLGKDVHWLDEADDISRFDFSGTFFITNHDVALSLPVRDDCFYLVHGGNCPKVHAHLGRVRGFMSWNVFHDFSHVYGPQGNARFEFLAPGIPLTRPVLLDEDMPFYPAERHLDFRWATDLLPHEIEANKAGAVPLNSASRVINLVGTIWHVNQNEISAFRRACGECGIEFRHIGAGQVSPEYSYRGWQKVVSPEDNRRLMRESYFAPAISGSHHLTEGYAPCRIFKNISFGCFGVTNSRRVNDIFGGKLIFDPDPYRLFYTARERLAGTSVGELYVLMDEVAAKHTYLNRLSGIFKAAKTII